MKIEREVCLKSSQLVHAAGLVNWARVMYRQHPRKATKLLAECWALSNNEARQILTKPDQCRVDNETGDLHCVLSVDAKSLAI
jgi:hypothetical protein